MTLDDAVQIVKPSPDSQYRLVPCRCGSDNVAYMLGVDGQWRGMCFACDTQGPGSTVRHDAQVKWNKEVNNA